jgi:hypothetical protein
MAHYDFRGDRREVRTYENLGLITLSLHQRAAKEGEVSRESGRENREWRAKFEFCPGDHGSQHAGGVSNS